VFGQQLLCIRLCFPFEALSQLPGCGTAGALQVEALQTSESSHNAALHGRTECGNMDKRNADSIRLLCADDVFSLATAVVAVSSKHSTTSPIIPPSWRLSRVVSTSQRNAAS